MEKQFTEQQSMKNFPVVGLGASAGGVKALQTFFDGIPADSGMAYVVIMHLSPHHESSLAQIIQARTPTPVVQVESSCPLEANHVYVIPPGKHLILQDGTVEAVDPQQPPGLRVSVDLFFRTLAATYGQRAVSVVLSGTDSDGVIGIKHIKEQGGITIAQDPTDAEHDGMPRSAIDTGMVDWVLTAQQMPIRLLDFVKNEAAMHVPPDDPPAETYTEAEKPGGPITVRQIPSASDESALVELLRFVRGQTGHDFTHYKRATILRRVARRLQVNLIEDISTYLEFLRTHPAETTALLHDLLISVTNFFRDKEAFKILETHIPQLFAGKGMGDQVRVWVAGCATGEEAYSLAMFLSEHAAKLDNPPSIQVFATDIDEDVIQAARNGLYPLTIEADVSPERLRRFFQKDQGRYRIRKEIREMVLFSAHDLLKDSPFSRLDLITCRNLLIYLKREAQEQVFDVFHFALRSGGLLFLGSSESMDDSHALFAPLDKKHRLYVRRTMTRPNWQLPRLALATNATRYTNASLPRPPVAPTPSATEQNAALTSLPLPTPAVSERRGVMYGEMHLSLLEQYAPPSVLINEHQDIVHLSENAGQFLNLSGGEPSLNLMKVVHPDLRIDLRTALFRATQSGESVTAPMVALKRGEETHRVNLHVHPAASTDAEQGFVLVIFEQVRDAADPVPELARHAEPISRHLEEEISQLKEHLSVTVEQYEASVEELKASNEELQAMNEELRSASEELETSKEELQSINEELTTVNHELKSSLEELGRTNSDLQNLMASTEIGTIFLDRSLKIKRFTPRVQELFNVISTDIGRPLTDITHKLNYSELMRDAERVLRTLTVSEREVSSDGHWFSARLLPYRTVDDRIDGIVLTFVDITERKQASDAVRASEERLQKAIDIETVGVIFFNNAIEITDCNEAFLRMSGYTRDEIQAGRLNWEAFTPEEFIQPSLHAIEELNSTGFSTPYEKEYIRKDGSRFWALFACRRIGENELVEFVTDTTERKRNEAERAILARETTLLTERNRMARELHDTLAQGFTGIKLQIDAAELNLDDNRDKVNQHLMRAREIASQSLTEARSSVRALRSGLTGSGSLATTLAQMAAQATDGVKVQFVQEGAACSLTETQTNDVYRIAQEAVTNALRHGEAQHIVIRLTCEETQTRLSIQDDGQGFDTGASRAGFGITGMQERAARLGSELSVNSEPGRGTEILLTMNANNNEPT